MPWLVDGNNLLGLSAERQAKDPKARARLVRSLAEFARAKRTQVTVVFDGEPGGDLPRERSDLGDLRVLFSGRHEDADSAILRLIDEAPDPAGCILVTSDRALGDRARHRRARVASSLSFRRKLEETAVPGQADEGLSPDEVERWRRIFETGDLDAS